ncbi:MAG TPA: hypothetical protein VII66_03380 [Gemmatimonadaceae bacterium]
MATKGISILGVVAVSIVVSARVCYAQGDKAAAGSMLTVDQVIARNIEARGGMDRVKAVQTATLKGHISFSPGNDNPLSVEMARPGRIRSEISVQGKSIIQAYDGQTAWTVNPLQGPTGPQIMASDAAKNVAAGGDMDGPLVDYKAKGNHVTLVGMDTADGRPAYKIAVKTASGLLDTYYIDAQSYMQARWEGNRVVNGEPVVFESYFRDYRPVDGVMWARRIDSYTEGQAGLQQIITDTIQLNRPIADTRFAMPSGTSGAPRR